MTLRRMKAKRKTTRRKKLATPTKGQNYERGAHPQSPGGRRALGGLDVEATARRASTTADDGRQGYPRHFRPLRKAPSPTSNANGSRPKKGSRSTAGRSRRNVKPRSWTRRSVDGSTRTSTSSGAARGGREARKDAAAKMRWPRRRSPPLSRRRRRRRRPKGRRTRAQGKAAGGDARAEPAHRDGFRGLGAGPCFDLVFWGRVGGVLCRVFLARRPPAGDSDRAASGRLNWSSICRGEIGVKAPRLVFESRKAWHAP